MNSLNQLGTTLKKKDERREHADLCFWRGRLWLASQFDDLLVGGHGPRRGKVNKDRDLKSARVAPSLIPDSTLFLALCLALLFIYLFNGRARDVSSILCSSSDCSAIITTTALLLLFTYLILTDSATKRRGQHTALIIIQTSPSQA